MQPVFDFIAVLLLTGAAQGVLLAMALLAIPRGNRMANRILALLLIFFAASITLHTLAYTRYLFEFPHLIKTTGLVIKVRWMLWGIAVAAATQLSAQEPAKNNLPMLMPREQEIELALSAAPEHLRQDATIYVLERGKGFIKAREGKNGFSCLVVRFGAIIAPYAYDAEGAQTTMLADFRHAVLMEQGKDIKEAERILAEKYKAGKLLAPRKPGVAYMLSPDFMKHDSKTGAKTPVFPPHVMFYATYVKNADIGALPEHFNSDKNVFVLNEGRPDAYFIIVPKDSKHTHGTQ